MTGITDSAQVRRDVKQWEPENTALGYNMRPCVSGSFVLAADYDKEVSDHNRLKEDTWALTQKLTADLDAERQRRFDGNEASSRENAQLSADNDRLREALEHIRAMQLRGFLVLGDKANGLMKAALAGSKKGDV